MDWGAILSTLEGILLVAGFFGIIGFSFHWTHYTRCRACGEFHRKGIIFCRDCGTRLLGPCESCGKHQKWRRLHCWQCGHKLGDPAPASSVDTRSIPNTSPSLTTINLSSCPDCRSYISPGATFCGNCGFNLEQTVIREQQ